MPGDLLATALAARKAIAAGKWVVMYKGGRSAEGQKAASSHTGALAGDWELQKALLKRAGAGERLVVTFRDKPLVDIVRHSPDKAVQGWKRPVRRVKFKEAGLSAAQMIIDARH